MLKGQQPFRRPCLDLVNLIYFVGHAIVIFIVSRKPAAWPPGRSAAIIGLVRMPVCPNNLETMKVADTTPAIPTVHEIIGKMRRVLVFGNICRDPAAIINLVIKIIGDARILAALGTNLIEQFPKIRLYGIVVVIGQNLVYILVGEFQDGQVTKCGRISDR